MIYNDGFPMDNNLRVTQCPKCGNEQFSQNAEHCRICGTLLYNYCVGEPIYDYQGSVDHIDKHKNCGNARFCETCGRPTEFFKEKFLLPFDEVREEYVEKLLKSNPSSIANGSAMVLGDDEGDDFPF